MMLETNKFTQKPLFAQNKQWHREKVICCCSPEAVFATQQNEWIAY